MTVVWIKSQQMFVVMLEARVKNIHSVLVSKIMQSLIPIASRAKIKVANKMTEELPGPNFYPTGHMTVVWIKSQQMFVAMLEARVKDIHSPATVWIFEKRLLDRYSKPQRNLLLEKLRHGVSSLTKLRHPRILSVMHPLEDSRDSLGFATEPVFTSLANALGRHDNLTGPITDKLTDFKFTDIELKYGILQICEALLFIHRDSRQLHLNVAPESIIINRMGSWKLCGFEFAKPLPVNRAQSEGDDDSVDVLCWQSTVLPLCQPQLDYSSPETVINGRATPSSDMFSVGMLLYALHNNGCSLFPCKDSYAAYRTGVNQLTYFHDPGVSALQSLDELRQLDNLARSRFYKNLPLSIRILPKRINLHRVYSQLSEEFVNPNMVPFVLPPILEIVDRISREEFTTVILPSFQKVLCIREPVQQLCLKSLPDVAQLMDFPVLKSSIVPRLKKAYLRNDLVSVGSDRRVRGDSSEFMGRQRVMYPSHISLLPCMARDTLGHHLLYISKNAISRERLVVAFASSLEFDLTGSRPRMRLETLICLGKILEYLDKWCVMEDVFPFLVEIKSREPTLIVAVLSPAFSSFYLKLNEVKHTYYAILLASFLTATAIYKVAFVHKKLGISRDILATRVIPHLLQLSMDSNLNLTQYTAFAELIRQMITQLETEQKAKLSELHGQTEESA
ncbi:unnamed protein product [Schistocephalus solidus]|uniref:Protein kinase domain-containing protein n=1 Tax=Schistocephalus solidus TaxID=70667 RepID=A0A183SMR3_SCHSO|nr:unnamed protein product [Schistocephalus solidus]